jgi:hypothetical protein
MGSVVEWKSALEAAATFAALTAVGDVVLRFVFRSRSSLPARWTFPLVAGYFFRQALLGVWFGVAATLAGVRFTVSWRLSWSRRSWDG